MSIPKKLYQLHVIFLMQWVANCFVSAVDIDNGVKGRPDVVCGIHSIRVDVTTRNLFYGRMFIKGESDSSSCSTNSQTPTINYEIPFPILKDASALTEDDLENIENDINSDFENEAIPTDALPIVGDELPEVGGSKITFELSLGQCNMRRQRTLQPRGVEYYFTAVVSFHPLFITKVDRAYRIRCFYMEADNAVQQEMAISMMPTERIDQKAPIPKCHYSIKRGNYDGPALRYAKVGEIAFHVWECGPNMASVYSMLVRNCFVDNGKGRKFHLVDETGCTMDSHLLPELTYKTDISMAYVKTHIFKYADYPQVHFSCTLQLCLRENEECSEITPPKCSTIEEPTPTNIALPLHATPRPVTTDIPDMDSLTEESSRIRHREPRLRGGPGPAFSYLAYRISQLQAAKRKANGEPYVEFYSARHKRAHPNDDENTATTNENASISTTTMQSRVTIPAPASSTMTSTTSLPTSTDPRLKRRLSILMRQLKDDVLLMEEDVTAEPVVVMPVEEELESEEPADKYLHMLRQPKNDEDNDHTGITMSTPTKGGKPPADAPMFLDYNLNIPTSLDPKHDCPTVIEPLSSKSKVCVSVVEITVSLLGIVILGIICCGFAAFLMKSNQNLNSLVTEKIFHRY